MDSLFEINQGGTRHPFIIPFRDSGKATYFSDNPAIHHRSHGTPRRGLAEGPDTSKFKWRPGDLRVADERRGEYERKFREDSKKYPNIETYIHSQEHKDAFNASLYNAAEIQENNMNYDRQLKKEEEVRAKGAGQQFNVDVMRNAVGEGTVTSNAFRTNNEYLTSPGGVNWTPGPTRAYDAPVGTMKDWSEDINKLWTTQGNTTIVRSYEHVDPDTNLPYQVGDTEKGYNALQKSTKEYSSNLEQMHFAMARDKNGNIVAKNPLKMHTVSDEELVNIGSYAWNNLSPEGRAGIESSFIGNEGSRIASFEGKKEDVKKNYSSLLMNYVGRMSLDEAKRHVNTTSRVSDDWNMLGKINDGSGNADEKAKFWKLFLGNNLPENMYGVDQTNAPDLKYDENSSNTFYDKQEKREVTTLQANPITDEYINKMIVEKGKITGAVIVGGKYVPAGALTAATSESGTIVKNLGQIQNRTNVIGWNADGTPIVNKKQPLAPYFLAEVHVTAKDLLNPQFKDEYGRVGLKGFNPKFKEAGSKEEQNREQFLISENMTGYTSVNSEFNDQAYIRSGVDQDGYTWKGDYTVKVWIPFAPAQAANNFGANLTPGVAMPTYSKP